MVGPPAAAWAKRPAATATSPKCESPATTPAPTEAPADHAPLPHIDSKRAFQYTREVTAFGPRYMGSENHKKLEHYILDHLKADHLKDDQVKADAFTPTPQQRKFPVRTTIANFPA